MSIYERLPTQASEARQDRAPFRAATGAAVGAAAAFVLSNLGVPLIFGLDRFGTIVPLLLAGAVLGVTRFRRAAVWLTVTLIVVFCSVAYTDLVRGPAQRLIRRDVLPSAADAIVVLSSGVTADGMLEQQGLDRLLRGIELARAGIAPRIVLTRERRRKVGGGWITSAGDQSRLIAMGGGTQVISTGLVTSTREEALRVAELARRNGWKRIVLVTSPLHSRRACATFEKAGLTVSCVPSDSRDIAVRTLQGPDNRLRAFGMWIYELAGTLRYRWAGWI